MDFQPHIFDQHLRKNGVKPSHILELLQPEPGFLLTKGGRGVFDLGKVEIEFSIVSDRGECQLPDAFYQIKKYCSLPKFSDFEILKIWVITFTHFAFAFCIYSTK